MPSVLVRTENLSGLGKWGLPHAWLRLGQRGRRNLQLQNGRPRNVASSRLATHRNNSMKLTGEDNNGVKWAGELTPIEDTIRVGTPPAIGTGTPQRIGNTLYPEATEASLTRAVEASWAYYRQQYENFNMDGLGNVPDEAHARSQGAKALAIELPPGEIRLTEDLYWPAMIPMRSNADFAGATLRMQEGSRLCLLGIIDTDFGEVSPFGGGISGVQFAKTGGSHVVRLLGTFQDLRLVNIHTVTSMENGVDLFHARSQGVAFPSPYGLVSNSSNPHIKELEIIGGQFESRGKNATSIRLIAPKRSTINGARFIYGDLGIAATEADEFSVQSCNFTGDKGGLPCRVPMIIESSKNGTVVVSENCYYGSEHGAQLYVQDGTTLRQVSDANNFWNGTLDTRSTDYYDRERKVVKGAGVFPGGVAL